MLAEVSFWQGFYHMPYEVFHAADIYSRKEDKNYANTSGAYELGAGVVLHKSNQIEPNQIRV